jgi:hypothetical protein
MKTTTSACVVALMTICSSILPAQHRIDLRQAPPPPSTPSGAAVGGGVGPVIEGQPPLQLPLRVELAALGRSDISFGDRIDFEITITNPGPGAIRIPWTAADRLSPATSDQSEMRVAVVIAEEAPELAVASARLSAWTSRPETFLLLRPKETATVFAVAPFLPRTTQARETALVQDLPRVVNLKASLFMSHAASPRIATILSNNEVPTLLRVGASRR